MGSANAQTTKVNFSELESEVKEAATLRRSSEYDEALEMLYRVINELEEPETADQKVLKAKANNEISVIFKNIGFYDDALDYNQRAINLVEGLNDSLSGLYYHYRGNQYFKKGEAQLDINELDNKNPTDARKAYEKALLFYNKVSKNKNLTYLYLGIANTYIQEGKLKDSEVWIIKAQEQAEKHKNISHLMTANDLLVLVYKDQKKYLEAVNLGEKTLSLVKENELKHEDYPNIYLNLYRSYKGLNQNEEAYDYLEKYTDIKYSSSVEDQSSFEKINNKRIRAKAKDLEKREAITEKKVKKVKKFNIALLISMASLGLLSLFYTRGQRLKEKNLQLELKQKEQEAELLEQEAELNTINAMMDGRENERSEIGQYLHDHVSALVNTANIQLEVLANEANLHENKKLITTQTILDDIADKVRNLSHQLLSNVLQKYGLEVALDDLCTGLTGTKINFKSHSKLTKGRRFRENIENKLYSVIQELCNNILKHSQATEANIYLSESDTHLHLTITDNGIGIKQEDIKKGGVGLHQVKARIASMGGDVKISEGSPTTIKISIPLGIANLP